MNKWCRFIQTVWGRFLLFLVSIIGTPFILVANLLPQAWVLNNICYRMLVKFLCTFVCYFIKVPITVVGRENMPDRPAIFVVNHQSRLDIALIGRLMNGEPHVWFTLKSLLKSWVFKFLFPPFSIFVDMTSPMTGMKSLLQGVRILREQPL